MSLKDRIAAAQPSKTGRVRPVGERIALSTPKRRYGRIEYELWQIGQPQTNAYFGILRGPEDLATLINLRGTGAVSIEARQKIDDFLTKRANKAVAELKKWLGLRRGRPRDVSKQSVWLVADALREEDPEKNSWRALSRKLMPDEYASDPHGAMDRMRHGVGAVRERREKEKAPQN